MNPKAAYDAVFLSADLSLPNKYPKFIQKIEFENFRHINGLTINFSKPVTVVSGSNKSGKTSLLLSIACSHFDFKKRNYANGKLERQTWSDVLKFTDHDDQTSDWTYYLTIKTGAKVERKRGQRKYLTKKWNGLGKKESQIRDVNLIYLDLDRILPARYFSSVLHKKAKKAVAIEVSEHYQEMIDKYLSYIFEQEYSLKKLADHLGKDLLGFSVDKKYSSYNSASGEDVISRILIDCIEAPNNSLILIDELELGIHPKIQRRLMDVIFDISSRGSKQFIITSHSSTVISTVPDEARVFINPQLLDTKAISPISINAALSYMDSKSYPLIDIFCEDDLAKKIIHKTIDMLNKDKVEVKPELINIIDSGSADNTYRNFIVRKNLFDKVLIRSGHACILDGDMREEKTGVGDNKFPDQDGLYFLPSNLAPEKLLCDAYEKSHKNSSMRYHIDNSNSHCLFQKMMEIYHISNSNEVFELCWNELIKDEVFMEEFTALVDFIKKEILRYSPFL